MTNYSISKIGLGVLLACGAIHAHAEVAGRVLVAVGDNVAVRNGATLKLAAGAVVESGDLLRVGESSNMQVRFSDEAIVALRPNTEFQIEKYSFANKPETDSTVVSLLKGGMRTITGLIGRNSRANYAVKAQTSTIGIRGTHFTIVHCADDCRNADGSQAPNGTFGGVTDGRIAVSNEAGEREFGKDQFFFVSSRTSLPEGLMVPPTFLRDRLEGQAKSPGKGSTAAAAKETAKADAGSTDTNVSATPTNMAATTAVMTQAPANVTENIVSQNAVNPFTGYTDFAFAVGGPSHAGDGNTLQLSTAERKAEVARLKEIYPQALLESVDQGSSVAAGNVRWGRWLTTSTSVGEHWAVGVPTPGTALPVSGAYTYKPVGGTNPTDNLGNVGTVTSQGLVVANFTTKRVGTIQPVTWTIGGHDYSLSLTDQPILTNGTGGIVAVSCGDCASPTGEVAGNFTGDKGEGIIAGLYTSATFGGVTQTTGQVRVYSTEIPTATTMGPCTSYPCTRSYALAAGNAGSSSYTSGGQTYTQLNGDTVGGQYSVTVHSSSIPLVLDPPGLVELGMAMSGNSQTVNIADQGSNAVANLSWRRYDYTETTQSTNIHAVHMLYGDAVVSLPTSGSYTFSHVGGTVPTDHLGHAGTLNSAGSWNVDFAAKTMGTVTPVNWTVNSVTYNLSVPNQAWISGSQSGSSSEAFGSYSATVTKMGLENISLTCSPNCTVPVGPDTGNKVSPAFMGSGAQALGVGYSTNVVVGGGNQVTSHAQAYQR